MKKLCVLLLLMAPFVLEFCSSSKNAAKKHQTVTYTNDVQPLMVANCSPCHFPPKGNKKPFDSYTAAKTNIDEMISRVQRNPGDKGFMPAMHPKLPDSTINILIAWKNAGTPE